MKLLFNHGFSGNNLYIAVPAKISTLKFKHLKTSTNKLLYCSREDSYGIILEYFIATMLRLMITERKRFVFPSWKTTYFDFQTVTEEEFEEARQLGRFEGIDFIATNFTGYRIMVSFNKKGIRHKQNVYLGADLKELFLNTVNSGTKMYTTEDFTFEYLLNEARKDYFMWIPKKEFERIIRFGLKRMEACIRFGLSISFKTDCLVRTFIHIGYIYLCRENQIKHYSSKMGRKLRKIYQWTREEYNGYMYIGLRIDELKDWVERNKYTRFRVKFDRPILRKIQEEWYTNGSEIHLFRIPMKDPGYWLKRLEGVHMYPNPEYIGKCTKLKFEPSTKTWKELLNEERNK